MVRPSTELSQAWIADLRALFTGPGAKSKVEVCRAVGLSRETLRRILVGDLTRVGSKVHTKLAQILEPTHSSRRHVIALRDAFAASLTRKTGARRTVVLLGSGALEWAGLGPERWRALGPDLLGRLLSRTQDKETLLRELWRELSELEVVGLPPRDVEDMHTKLLELVEAHEVQTQHVCAAAWHRPASRSEIVDFLRTDFFERERPTTDTSDPTAAAADDEYAGPVPTLASELLAHMLAHKMIAAVLTTNVDEQLEESLVCELGADGYDNIIAGATLASGPSEPDRPRLVKLRGTISNPETLGFASTLKSQLPPDVVQALDDTIGKTGRARIVSLGYGWEKSLANYVISRRDSIEELFVVRRGEGRPSELERWPVACHVISTDTLHSGLSVDQLLWAICASVEARVNELDQAPFARASPIGRHLLLSYLFGRGFPERLRGNVRSLHYRNRHTKGLRTQAEVLLALTKLRGHASTYWLSRDRRIRRYAQDGWKSLSELVSRGVVKQSEVPGASDTFFSTARDLAGLAQMFYAQFEHAANTSGGVIPGSDQVEVPALLDDGRLRIGIEDGQVFFTRHVESIFLASETEVVPGRDPQLGWTFREHHPITTHAGLWEVVSEIVASDWSELLVITEFSKSHAEELAKLSEAARAERRVLLLVPSRVGLDHWHLLDLLEKDNLERKDDRVVLRTLKWWEHNRHLTLAIDHGRLVRGTYARRYLKTSQISPAWVDTPHDCAHLLAVFLGHLHKTRRLDPRTTTEYGVFSRLAQETAAQVEQYYRESHEDRDVGVADQVKKAIDHYENP